MNLHIVPDYKFSQKFYSNLRQLGLLDNNKFVVRTHASKLTHVDASVPFAKLYSREFENLIGDTQSYDKVFIHLFHPLMYRWVARHTFKSLNWMVWGTDLYNLKDTEYSFYEPQTLKKFIKKDFSFQSLLLRLKIGLINSPFKKTAYKKVDHILTWMDTEYEYAKKSLPELHADHQFFFYENETAYSKLNEMVADAVTCYKKQPLLVLGNSATPNNNHLDTLTYLESQNIKADILIPVSYGNKRYIDFLKRELLFYTGGEITFMEKYMTFAEYVKLLYSTDGLIMNTLRPQGYGNILMMMQLGKPVYINKKNISLPDLDRLGLTWKPLEDLKNISGNSKNYRQEVELVFSSEKLTKAYRKLFS